MRLAESDKSLFTVSSVWKWNARQLDSHLALLRETVSLMGQLLNEVPDPLTSNNYVAVSRSLIINSQEGLHLWSLPNQRAFFHLIGWLDRFRLPRVARLHQ